MAASMVLVTLVAFVASACGATEGPTGGPGSAALGQGAAAGAGGPQSGSAAGPGSAVDPGSALVPDGIGDLGLQVVAYTVPDILDAVADRQLVAMLGALGLSPADVSLTIAVDPAGSLAVGRWELPGKWADAILDAWRDAAGTGWDAATLGDESALRGLGPDGRQAWAVAREGVFVYVVTDDPQLALAAVAATR